MKKKIAKIFLSLVLIIVLVLVVLNFYRYMFVYNFNIHGPYKLDIIEKINYGGFIMSWNTVKYGRIYAQLCNPKKNMFACSCNCMDGGVSFYDAKGKYIGDCNGRSGPSFLSDALLYFLTDCTYLENLAYTDADYKSERCEENETGYRLPWNNGQQGK